MIHISRNVSIPESELDMQAIRAQGAGGQNVNKVATAIHLRFDIRASSLPEFYKEKLLALTDQRVSREGVIIIKSQEHKSQEMNRQAAVERLVALIRRATKPEKARRPTKPSKAAKQKRVDAKTRRGKTKALRGKVRDA